VPVQFDEAIAARSSKLRARVRQRLKENAEVIGTDEAFFEVSFDHNL